MTGDIGEPPQRFSDGLGAQLLGQGDTLCLGLAVGVVRAQPDPEPVIEGEQDRLGLAAGCIAGNLDGRVGGEQAGSEPVEGGGLGGAGHAQGLELGDMGLHGRGVAPGPTGDDQVLDKDLVGPL